MRRCSFTVKGRLLLAAMSAALLLIPAVASAAGGNCGDRDESVHKACKIVQYKTLPADLKKLLAQMKCDVKSGSNYDYGYAVDLDSDGKPEYAFCCEEAKHGPCGMKIFGKSSGKWKVLYDYMPGFTDDKTACFGLTVSKKKHSGYNDVCIDDGASGIIIFKDGKYQDAEVK